MVADSNPTEAPKGASVAPRLQVDSLAKFYGAVHAVRDVSFEANPGEVVALVGENGAGKSTVSKIIAGAVIRSSGEIRVDGQLVVASSVGDSRRIGVSCAFQELSLIPGLTVGENLELVDKKPLSVFSQKKARTVGEEVLKTLKISHIDPESLVSNLSLADRQQIEIARSLVGNPRLLILDEASSALTPPGVEWLFERIRDFTADGGTVIYVSHRMSELEQIADRVIVMRDGERVGEFAKGQWSRDQLVSLMAGREASSQFPETTELRKISEPILRVKNLRSDRIAGIDLEVFPGEIVGIGGLAGNGQSELLSALFGARHAKADEWIFDGKKIKRLTPRVAVELGLGFVPEDRKLQGLALSLGVGENLVVPWQKLFGLGGKPVIKGQQSWLNNVINSLSVKTRGTQEAAGALSGGNQQKLVFGRWVDRNRKLLLLHDPTRGVDVGAKQDLYASILRLSEAGIAVLWLSTEVEEIVNVCHRAVVMYQGEIVGNLRGEHLTADGVVGAAMGGTK